MYKFREKLSRDITGNLTIHKRNKDGTEELWFDDHNVIVSGMSVALSLFFTGSGSTTITDYQIDRFQVGISGVPALPDASTTYQLSGPLDNETAYGGDSGDLYVRTAHQIKKGSITTGSIYALIPFSRVTRIDDTSVRYTIVLDEGACNDLKETDGGGNDNLDVNLNEIGLFIKDPIGRKAPPASILVAYRSFTAIRKTEDFALIFRWTINF